MGRTQAEIAEELGVGQKTVSRVLREEEIVQNSQNGNVAVLTNPKKGNDNGMVDCDPEPDGLNICTFFVNPYPDERGNTIEKVRYGIC